jgi:dihydrolipoamide dehydrogenase
MKHFDVLVIGSGSGMSIANQSLMNGLTVALVESGPLGGTCLNRGCIPSKMVIYPADVINVIKDSKKFGIKASIESVDFRFVMDRMRHFIAEDRSHMEDGIGHVPGLTFYNDVGEFISDYTMRVSSETIKADNVFIVSGSRPKIPPIKSLENVEYLTSVNVWDIKEVPNSMIFIGGGYIAVEFAHFFSSFGSDVTIISRSQRLVKRSEPEISEFLKRTIEKRMTIVTGFEAVAVVENEGLKEVVAINRETGEEHAFSAESLFISSGRRSNSDLLKPERTGVELDDRGFVVVNEFLETSKERIWAFGDAIGKHMFKHVANYEAGIAWHNFSHKGHKIPINYSSVPYGVFSYPQVASVGMTEREAREKGYNILVGRQELKETAKGAAMNEEGFVKVIVEEKTGKILGGHIVGPYAPTIIQEIINAMNSGDGSYSPITQAMHIHPALSEVVQFAFYNLHKPHEH